MQQGFSGLKVLECGAMLIWGCDPLPSCFHVGDRLLTPPPGRMEQSPAPGAPALWEAWLWGQSGLQGEGTRRKE
jgi:hypothetical protein